MKDVCVYFLHFTDSDDSFVRSLLNLEGDPHLDVENGGHIQAFSSDIVPEHSVG